MTSVHSPTLKRVLAEHEGNISATARALKMHRRTLQRKLGKKPVWIFAWTIQQG